MAASTKTLTSARNQKSDEFYTRIQDIEKELVNYKEQLNGKIVYCNCDMVDKNGLISNFVRYFVAHFKQFGLKKLISTGFVEGGHGVKFTMESNGSTSIENLDGDGSCFSNECVSILDSSDVVVTNPPFSRFREFINLLVNHNKKFLIIGNINAITCKDVYPLIVERKVWFGLSNFNGGMYFNVPNEYEFNEGYDFDKEIDGKKCMRLSSVCWYTNLENDDKKGFIPLTKTYSDSEYVKYDNYDAIEVSRFPNIPKDYEGVMGVPITILGKFNPSQFELIGITIPRAKIDGKTLYARLLIRNKNPKRKAG